MMQKLWNWSVSWTVKLSPALVRTLSQIQFYHCKTRTGWSVAVLLNDMGSSAALNIFFFFLIIIPLENIEEGHYISVTFLRFVNNLWNCQEHYSGNWKAWNEGAVLRAKSALGLCVSFLFPTMVILICKIILSPSGKSQKLNLSLLCLKYLASSAQVTLLNFLVSWEMTCRILNTNLLSLWPVLIKHKVEVLSLSFFGGLADKLHGRVKWSSRLCFLLKSENTLFCLQQNWTCFWYKCEKNSCRAFRGHFWQKQFVNF